MAQYSLPLYFALNHSWNRTSAASSRAHLFEIGGLGGVQILRGPVDFLNHVRIADRYGVVQRMYLHGCRRCSKLMQADRPGREVFAIGSYRRRMPILIFVFQDRHDDKAAG